MQDEKNYLGSLLLNRTKVSVYLELFKYYKLKVIAFLTVLYFGLNNLLFKYCYVELEYFMWLIF